MCASLSFISGVFRACVVAPFNLSTTSFGMPAGPTMANQAVMSKPGRISAMAGTSGASGVRLGDVTPSARMVLPLTWASALPMSAKV